MKHIIISGNNLLDIVNNVLDISKLESGKISISENTYNMNKLIDEVISNAKTKLGEKNIKFILKVSPTLCKSYKGDVIKIYQILTNVISNSIKYTNVGRITFEVTNTKISSGDKILFKITDTGEGISEEEQSKILNKIEDKEEENTGYGLAIARKYTELLNGKIWFKSEFKVGTTFYIEIPQVIVNSELIEETSKIIDVDKKQISYNGLTALLVDDNKLNAQVVKRVLERYGFTVATAISGQECIYKIKKEEHFDIIFMDQVMEEMSGIETMKALKSLTEYKIPPIVSLTANALSGIKELYLEEGFDAYLPKPINTLALEEVLKKVINK
jgi:CheY-like chemotaxis protein